MRITRISWTVLLMIIVVTSGALAKAQQSPVDSTKPRPELALTYTFVHANAPPGGCGCFSLNGGSAEFAWPVGLRGLALAGDVTVGHTNSIGSSGASLTLSSFTTGVRYAPPFKRTRFQPFGEVLVGYSHISGSLVQSVQGQTTSSSNGFAANLGGGLDAQINKRLSLRLIEADYLVTTFDNGINNHQNLLRVSTGIVLRF
jgi:outer membrane immunogenic protein